MPSSIFDQGPDYVGPATPDSPSVFNTDDENVIVKESASVKEVMSIQNAVKNKGFSPGAIDGKFGPKTCAALLAFQRQKWGDLKAGYLDYETFIALGFDVQRADRLAQRYGMACGATKIPQKELDRGNIDVDNQDIMDLQGKLKVSKTGTFDKATCKALRAVQAQNGKGHIDVLLSSTFESLGYTGTQAKLYASAFSGACGGVVEPQPVSPSKKKPAAKKVPKKSTPKKEEVEIKKAGMPWPLYIFGGLVLASVIYVGAKKYLKKSKKSK